MNTKELKVEMLRHGDTGVTLSKALGMSEVSFSNKLNAKDTEFTQSDIATIRKRYDLTPERVVEIFLE